jgi:hypothetical protein
MKRAIVLALLLAAPAAAATLPSPNWPAPADRGDVLLRDAVLKAQNEARARFGVAPMAWSDELAAEALGHAQYMASTGIYGHDQTPGRRKKQGENLWRGQRGVFSYDVMIGTMVAEERVFRPGTFPHVRPRGDWLVVAHNTHIVWPRTPHVGWAAGRSTTTDYLFCRYSPTGNKDGLFMAAASQLAQGGN